MPLPNKLFSYEQSILSKFPLILGKLQNSSYTVQQLYLEVKDNVNCISEFAEILDALFALRKIDFSDTGELYLC